MFRGTIADLNAALGTLNYYGDQDFNTGTLAERLVITVNDLGNTDMLTPTGISIRRVTTRLTGPQTLTITVSRRTMRRYWTCRRW